MYISITAVEEGTIPPRVPIDRDGEERGGVEREKNRVGGGSYGKMIKIKGGRGGGSDLYFDR
jgi:hypothetical protein